MVKIGSPIGRDKRVVLEYGQLARPLLNERLNAGLRRYARPSLGRQDGLALSHMPVIVRASRSPIKPVVPKAKGNQRGTPRKVGLA